MPSYTQTVYDDFSSGSFNTSLWTRPDGTTGITQSSGTLKIAANSASPEVDSTAFKDLHAGLWAVQWSHTGTGTADSGGGGSSGTECYWGFADASDKYFELQTWPVSNEWYPWADGVGASVSGATGNQNMLGSAWTANDYIGIGDYNINSDNKIHVYKSTDAVTWTEIASFVVTGAINMSAAAFFFGTNQITSSSTWVSVFDNASFFTRGASLPGKVRSGGAWVKPTAVKVRSGGAWVVPTTTKVRSGGAWVVPTN